jgi:hypothetical protein
MTIILLNSYIKKFEQIEKSILTQKLLLSSQKYGLGIRDLGFGKNLTLSIGLKKHRIPDP